MREKFFLPATLIMCAILFISWRQFFYEPTQREILSMNLETRRLREVERSIENLKARHGNLETFVAERERQLDEARIFLPTTLMQDKFIDELYRAADFSQARLISVQAEKIIAADEIQAQVVAVKLEANYGALLNFIREVLDGGRLVSLENFSVEGDNVLTCTLDFKIFSAPSKAIERPAAVK